MEDNIVLVHFFAAQDIEIKRLNHLKRIYSEFRERHIELVTVLSKNEQSCWDYLAREHAFFWKVVPRENWWSSLPAANRVMLIKKGDIVSVYEDLHHLHIALKEIT